LLEDLDCPERGWLTVFGGARGRVRELGTGGVDVLPTDVGV